MPLLFNGYDLGAILCEQEVRIAVAEAMIDKMIASGKTIQVSQPEIDQIRGRIIESVKKKFPGFWPSN